MDHAPLALNNAQILGVILLTVVGLICLADICVWMWRARRRPVAVATRD
jgi:uncharacterized iron-regulated membrane protein